MISEAKRKWLEKNPNYSRLWVASRRSAFFAGKCCVQCGATERLELDHIDPTTKTTHAIFSWSQERREMELSKCQVLCHACHMEKTRKFNREWMLGVANIRCRKLTDEQVSEVKQLLACGVAERTIAEQFGVGKTTIHTIKTGELYSASIVKPLKLTRKSA